MATVWLARVTGKHGFEKLVAVKTIVPHLASEDGFRTMFLDEASIASRIRHPNVADILDLGEEGATLYMVLEWINGDSWSKLWAAIQQRGEAFPIPLLLRIAADACAGLHAAHELRDENGTLLNVVHRDVSPQNVMITVGGVTKVIDFGIAKAMDRTSENTRTGLIKGKAQYTAPEQVRSRDFDRRVDLWAIGTVLYHYLSGRLPYEARNDLLVLKLLTEGKPPPPLPSTLPSAVVDVVMRALAVNPDQRFQTALDMQRALEAVLPQPVTTTDVAAFLCERLQDRIEMRRKDLAEAIAELEEKAGKPAKPRQRMGSLSELAPPPILDQVLGRSPQAGSQASPRRAGESSQVPQMSPVAAAKVLGEGPAVPQAPPSVAQASAGGAGPKPRGADEELQTRMRDGPLRPVHFAMMIVGSLVPLLVWGLVAWVAMHGPIGHKAAAKKDAVAQPAH